jgi:hypothetical protein
MMDDKLTHLEISIKALEAQLARRDKTPPKVEER